MKFDIARAWKDEAYRQTLSEEELHLLPANPAGELELTDAELDTVAGGFCPPTVIIDHRTTSVAIICEINIFSVNLINLAVLGAVNNICTNAN
jgi:mersacidin/lichenicidin family type 2 lantibiotic